MIKPHIAPHIKDPRYLLDLIRLAFDKHQIKFSKREAAKIVGGEYRLEKLVMSGEIRMDKPTCKQNGKWFCNGFDVLRNVKF